MHADLKDGKNVSTKTCAHILKYVQMQLNQKCNTRRGAAVNHAKIWTNKREYNPHVSTWPSLISCSSWKVMSHKNLNFNSLPARSGLILFHPSPRMPYTNHQVQSKKNGTLKNSVSQNGWKPPSLSNNLSSSNVKAIWPMNTKLPPLWKIFIRTRKFRHELGSSSVLPKLQDFVPLQTAYTVMPWQTS